MPTKLSHSTITLTSQVAIGNLKLCLHATNFDPFTGVNLFTWMFVDDANIIVGWRHITNSMASGHILSLCELFQILLNCPVSSQALHTFSHIGQISSLFIWNTPIWIHARARVLIPWELRLTDWGEGGRSGIRMRIAIAFVLKSVTRTMLKIHPVGGLQDWLCLSKSLGNSILFHIVKAQNKSNHIGFYKGRLYWAWKVFLNEL